MKSMIRSGFIWMAIAMATTAIAAPFTDGNLVIYRLGGDASGNASGALTNSGVLVWLDEYTTNGVFVQSFMMPTNYFGANSPLIGHGTAFGSGLITRSVDGRFILVNGYAAAPGQVTGSIQSPTATVVPRVLGLVDGNGLINTTTVQTNALANGDELRSTASTDGTNLWFAGSVNGIRYTTRGNALATQIGTSVNNVRQLQIYTNQLYASSAAGSFRLLTAGPGLPTTSGQVYTNLPGIPTSGISPFGFAFFNLNGGGDPDTVYFTDSTASTIEKYSLVGGTWVKNGDVLIGGAVGLAARVRNDGMTVDLWTTGGGASSTGADSLWHVTDSAGYNAAPNITGGNPFIPLVTTPGQVSFRGVTFAPQGGEAFPSGPGRISVGPILGLFASTQTGCVSSVTQTYSVANFGTDAVDWEVSADVNWVDFSVSSGSLDPSEDVTVVASFNANAASLGAGTNTATITFTNLTSELGTTTRLVRLIVDGQQQTIAPTTGLNANGLPGGPFSPLSQTYTLTTAGTSIDWSVSSTQSWVELSATSGTLDACSSTNITVSINTNVANSLAVGFYSDTVVFSNVTAGTVIGTRTVTLNVSLIQFFCDDYSTFNEGNIAGQQGWSQHGTQGNLPIQISNGKLAMPAGQTTDNQDVVKSFPVTTSNTVFWGMSITVTSVPVGAVSFIGGLCTSNNGTVNQSGSFLNYRVGVTNNGSGFIAFNARTTGLAPTPPINGPFTLSTGTTYRLIVQTDPLGSNTTVYVNPTSDEVENETPYLIAAPTGTLTGTQPGVTVGSLLISQFASATVNNPGVLIGKMCVSTSFADVFNGIDGGGPMDPFEIWRNTYFTMSQLADPNFSGPNADPFGKGFSNTNQFLAGFNPTNSAAFLRVISTAREGNHVRITYLGANGDSNVGIASRTNLLEFTTGASGNFSNNFATTGLTNILSGGTGDGVVTNFLHENGATNPAGYYRIRVLFP